MNRITDIWRNGCTLEKLMIIWFTPHKTTTFTKWMFFHKRFVMASAAFKYGPHQQRRPLPSLLSDSYSLVCVSQVCACMIAIGPGCGHSLSRGRWPGSTRRERTPSSTSMISVHKIITIPTIPLTGNSCGEERIFPKAAALYWVPRFSQRGL